MAAMNHDIYPVRIRLHELGPEVDRRAEAETGGNRSKLIRQALEAFFSGRTPGEHAGLAELTKAVKDLRADMGRVGGNLNQLARYLNIHHTIQPHELATEHQELRRQLRALMTVVKRINGQLNDRKD